MSNNLLPINYTSESQVISDSAVNEESFTGYKESAFFDFHSGDFTRNGAKQIVRSSGTDAWIQWCIKTINTPRYGCFAYSTDIGIDIESAFSATTKSEAESIFTREITEALKADPYNRLSYIQEIAFDWGVDTEVTISVIVVGIDGNTAEITATLPKER